jgi:SH3-like domain-containing protein
VQPPVEVEVATWTAACTLDYWVQEEREWWGSVRDPDGHQTWIRASDIRQSSAFNQYHVAVT